MPRDIHHLEAVLAAAQRLLDMREAEQVTAEEWDGLRRAVDDVGSDPSPRPAAATGLEGLLWDLLAAMRRAHEEHDVGHYLFDYARRCGGVLEIGTFLDGAGRKGLSVRTGAGGFLVIVEPRP